MENKNSIARSMYKRKYIIRHEILGALQKYQDYVYSLTAPMETLHDIELVLGVEGLVEKTNFSEMEIIAELEILLDKRQIQSFTEDLKNYYAITRSGAVAYYDKFYLEEGRKTVIGMLKDYISIVTAVGLFIIAVYSFVANIIQTNSNTKDLENIKTELDSLSKKIK